MSLTTASYIQSLPPFVLAPTSPARDRERIRPGRWIGGQSRVKLAPMEPNQFKDYPVVLSQDILWGDMDAFGHINNTVYFRYFEDGRIAYFDRIGLTATLEQTKTGPILAKALCNFRLPLDYPDRIHIATRSRILSAKTFNMEYAVFSEKHQAIAAEGEGLIVYYDYANGKSCEIPEAVITALNALEA